LSPGDPAEHGRRGQRDDYDGHLEGESRRSPYEPPRKHYGQRSDDYRRDAGMSRRLAQCMSAPSQRGSSERTPVMDIERRWTHRVLGMADSVPTFKYVGGDSACERIHGTL